MTQRPLFATRLRGLMAGLALVVPWLGAVGGAVDRWSERGKQNTEVEATQTTATGGSQTGTDGSTGENGTGENGTGDGSTGATPARVTAPVRAVRTLRATCRRARPRRRSCAAA